MTKKWMRKKFQEPACGGQRHLPHEVILEILSRLPVKSLLKFKCVSKSWLCSISNSQFIKTHMERSANNTDYTHHKLIAYSDSRRYGFNYCSLWSLIEEPTIHAEKVDDSPFKKLCHPDVIVGSSNGLICIAIGEDIYFWNPSTRKSKRLPDSGFKGLFAVDAKYGFGYDECNDDYEVVALFSVTSPTAKTKVKVYSLKTDFWMIIKDFPSDYPHYSKSGKFVNGKFHWCEYSDWWPRGIVSLDLAMGEYGELEMPNCGGTSSFPTLAVLGGFLCFTCMRQEILVDLWLMKQYEVGESWIKVFTMPIYSSIPLWLSRKGEILMLLGDCFTLYNSKYSSLRHPKIDMDKWIDAIIYVESLVSPNASDHDEWQPE